MVLQLVHTILKTTVHEYEYHQQWIPGVVEAHANESFFDGLSLFTLSLPNDSIFLLTLTSMMMIAL